MDHKSRDIDLGDVEEKLLQCIAEDEKRQRENDAKIRAVEQNVPTYEDFRQIVLGSNLQPLEKKDKKPILRFKIWNTSISPDDASRNKPSSHKSASGQPAKSSSSKDLLDPRITSSEFYRLWKNTPDGPKERYNLLVRIPEPALITVLDGDYMHMLWSDIIKALVHIGRDSKDVQIVTAILRVFSIGNKFKLVVSFMTQEDKKCLSRLFKILQQSSTSADFTSELDHLENIYLTEED